MKLKKWLGVTLLAIPLYFFTPNTAKAEEFTINLKNPEIKIEQTEKTKKTNIVNDFETIITNLDFDDFLKRSEKRMENRIYEKNFLLDVTPETRYYLFNWEAPKYMGDIQKQAYMETVNKEIQKMMLKDIKKEASQDFKESKLYEWLKEEQGYYKKWARGKFDGILRLKEKKFFITETGGLDFTYKNQKLKNVSEASTHKEDRFKFKFRGSSLSADVKDFFEFKIKANPFGFHKWDYNPRLDVYVTTKYGTVHNRTTYLLMDKKFKTSVSTTLPQGFSISTDYEMDQKDGENTLSTTLYKNIKDYQLSLSLSKTHYQDERNGASTVMFEIKKTW